MAAPEQAFRFLDLPKELRLMVYERIPILNKHKKFTQHDASGEDVDGQYRPLYTFTIVSPSVAVSILATNHQICSEAKHIIAKKLQDILSWRPKIIVDIDDLISLWEYGGPLIPIHGYAFALKKDPTIRFATYIDQANQSWNRVRYRSPDFQSFPYDRYNSSVVKNSEIVECIGRLARQMAHGLTSPDNQSLRQLEIGVITDDTQFLSDTLSVPLRVAARAASLRWDRFFNYKFSLSVRFISLHRSDIVSTHVQRFFWDLQPRPEICKYYMQSICDAVGEKEWDQDWAEGERL